MTSILEIFRKSIIRDSEANLKQRLDNCRANKNYAEYAVAVKKELD